MSENGDSRHYCPVFSDQIFAAAFSADFVEMGVHRPTAIRSTSIGHGLSDTFRATVAGAGAVRALSSGSRAAPRAQTRQARWLPQSSKNCLRWNTGCVEALLPGMLPNGRDAHPTLTAGESYIKAMFSSSTCSALSRQRPSWPAVAVREHRPARTTPTSTTHIWPFDESGHG